MRARTLVVAAASLGLAAAGCGVLLPKSLGRRDVWSVQMALKDRRVLEVSSDSERMASEQDFESLRDRPEFVIRGHRIVIEDDQVWLDGEPLAEIRGHVRTVTITERRGKLRVVADGQPIRETVLK